MDGIILVNKDKNYTSRDVVNVVGKCLNTKKVGHSGTLDPLATGILVVAVNKGLKIVNLLTSLEKEYIVDVSVGLLTDTLDITGKVLKEERQELSKEKLEIVLNSFVGKYLQEVPIYSAVKVNGKRLYEYARSGLEVELPKREVNIKEIELLDFNKDSFKFRVLVSKGTYIRSLVRDVGLKLGVYLTMSDLCRSKQGVFSIDQCNSLDDIKSDKYKLISLYEALSNYNMVEVDEFVYKKINNGAILDNIYNEDVVVFVKDKEVLAIYKKYDKDYTKIKPIHVLI